MTGRPTVSDASVLIGLSRIGRLALLERLFCEVAIPPAVLTEVTREANRPGAAEVLAAIGGWIRVRSPGSVPPRPHALGLGEWETLALAEEIRASGHQVLLLLDERSARRHAVSRGLQPMGILGVLLLAKDTGDIPEVRPVLEELRAVGFRFTDVLWRQVLDAAGEQET